MCALLIPSVGGLVDRPSATIDRRPASIEDEYARRAAANGTVLARLRVAQRERAAPEALCAALMRIGEMPEAGHP
jgi:hypothetical protein